MIRYLITFVQLGWPGKHLRVCPSVALCSLDFEKGSLIFIKHVCGLCGSLCSDHKPKNLGNTILLHVFVGMLENNFGQAVLQLPHPR